MGIRGLSNFLKNKVPKAHRSIAWNSVDYKGQRWGVDCQCLLHRARGEGLSPLTVIAALIMRLRRMGVEPVFVFDGRPPAAKADVIADRRVVRQAVQKEMAEVQAEIATGRLTEVEQIAAQTRIDGLQKKAPQITNGDRDEIKRFLYAAGVLFVTAQGEADDVLAFQCRAGALQAVISTDMDMLARGVPLLIVPDTNDASVMTGITLNTVLVGLGLTYEQFVDACVLMGCDYTGKDWRSWTPWVAVAAISAGTVQDISGASPAAAMLRGDGVAWEQVLAEGQRTKWAAGVPAVERDNLYEFCQKNAWPIDWMRVIAEGR
jgi:flap endonuclease-1